MPILSPAHLRRLSELKRLAVLDTETEACYDDMAKMAASICGASMAVIALLDEHRQWFKAKLGVPVEETPLEFAFCAQTLEAHDTVIVEDASLDPRFALNPFVTGAPHIRFYASAKLVTLSGIVVGTLCVMDTVPRRINAAQLERLQFAAQQIIYMLEMRAR